MSRDHSEDPGLVGPGRVTGHSWRSGTGWGTHGEVRDKSGDYPGGPGWVR